MKINIALVMALFLAAAVNCRNLDNYENNEIDESGGGELTFF